MECKMSNYKRLDEPTPNGGSYSEIYYFNDKGEIVDEMSATRCVIRECTKDGELLNEIWGFVKQNQNDVL